MSSKKDKLAAALIKATEVQRASGSTPPIQKNASKPSTMDARFIGSTTTNGEIQDMSDPRVFLRKSRDGDDVAKRKMSVYITSELADRLDVACVTLKPQLKLADRSEVIELAIRTFLDVQGA